MKTWMTVIVIVVLLVIGVIWSDHYLNASVASLVQNINYLEELVDSQNWEQAKNFTEQIENDWNVYKNVWTALVTHHEIDDIGLTLKSLRECIQTKELTLVKCNIATLRLLVEQTVESQAFNLKNVL